MGLPTLWDSLMSYEDNEAYDGLDYKYAYVNLTTHEVYEVSNIEEELDGSGFEGYISDSDKIGILNIKKNMFKSVA